MDLMRYWHSAKTITVHSSVASSETINFGDYSSMVLVPPAGWTTATLSVYVQSPSVTSTYLPLYDSTGTAVTVTVTANQAIECPSSVFGANKIRFQADSAANNAVPLQIMLKG